MFGRYQPPALSPVTLRALQVGAGALFSHSGERQARLAEYLRDQFDAARIVFTDCGTSSLRLAIEGALAARPGLVALPAFSCYDVSSAVEGAGADFLLYDIDPRTLGPDPESLRRALEAGASVVVLAHLYGVPVNLGEVVDLTNRWGGLIIEDAAQGAGARYRGGRLGAHGSLGVLSFARGKGITGGGGGALLANDEAGVGILEPIVARQAELAQGWRDLMRAAAVWLLGRPSLYSLAASLPFLHLGETVYRPPRQPGPASRAGLGVLSATWLLSDREAEVRRRHASRLLAAIGSPAHLLPPRIVEGASPGYLRLPLLTSSDVRQRATQPSARALGIALSYPQPLSALQSSAAACCNRDVRFSGASELARNLITLPTHSRLAERDIESLQRWIREVHGRVEGG